MESPWCNLGIKREVACEQSLEGISIVATIFKHALSERSAFVKLLGSQRVQVILRERWLILSWSEGYGGKEERLVLGND